jgi:DNA polymerase-1
MCQWFLRWDKYDSALDQYKEDDRGSFADAPNEVLWQYCGYDCDGTFRLRKIFKPMLRAEKQLTSFKTELNLINVLADVEYRGIHASRERIKEMADVLRHDRAKAQRKLARIALKLLGPKVAGEDGGKFNPNSPAQLAPLLLKAGAELKKKTPSGAFSTDKYVLAALALRKNRAGTIAKAQREIRSLNKKLSYLDEGRGGGFIVFVKEHDRMHPTYNVTVARTARLSATSPHIQTVPRTGGLRSMFTPDVPARDIFLSADYNKIELCVMAWLSNDRVMARELLSGVDLHTHMAVTTRLMRVPTDAEFARIAEEISAQERGVAKGVNFGVPYGRQAPSIAEANPEAFPETMPRNERIGQVDKVLDAYALKYRGVMRYMDRQINRARTRQYLRSYLFGRKRRFHGMDWFDSRWAQDCIFRDKDLGHLENEARNFEIQDTASTILNRATPRCYEGIKRERIPGFRIVLTLHDQLLFNCPLRWADEAEELIKKWMGTTLTPDKRHKYKIPITVDVKRQEAWGVELGGKYEYE